MHMVRQDDPGVGDEGTRRAGQAHGFAETRDLDDERSAKATVKNIDAPEMRGRR